MTLPTALEPMLAFRQFITYILVPSARPGKMDKMPTDWRDGSVHDAHDPTIWTDYWTAHQAGLVGFVFTDDDPFWFVDVDDCLLPTGWSPLAQEICAMLPGAAVEVSSSGKGLHLFGTGHAPKHSSRGPAKSGLEFYHTKRFVALGRPETAAGSCLTDCTSGVSAMVAKYFPRGVEVETPANWTTEPVPEWRGPTDDDDLIRRACASKSAAGVFGAKATFQQIWDADAAALAKAYPDMGERTYDQSAADAALSQHLAFWTGRNAERMRTLMRRSKLSREKWERDDYLPRTILATLSRPCDVCQDKQKDLTPKLEVRREAREVVGERYLHPSDQKILFAGCVYVADRHAIFCPGGEVYKKEQFDAMFGGYSFVMGTDNAKVSKSAYEAFTGSQALDHPKVETSSFRPNHPLGDVWIEGNRRQVNTYWPITTPSKRGNPLPFLDHLAKILPIERDRAIVLAYMAAVVQHPGVKFQWCPLIQGAPGNGKSLLSRCVVAAIGQKYCHTPNSSELTDKFNDWLDEKIFIMVEDIYVPSERKEVMEALKPMITSDWLEIQGKGKDKSSRFVCANFMLNSNHKDALKLTKDDRRFAVFFCAQQSATDIVRDKMGGQYFPNLYSWLRRDGYAIVTDFLRNYPIPAELNPAGDCHRAPDTSSTAEVLRESMGSLEQEVHAAVLEDRVGFRNGWISSYWLDRLIRDLGAGYRIALNKRRAMLEDMGYIAHPGLSAGQAANPVQPDGCKPRLFVRHGHSNSGIEGAAAIGRKYSHDQLDPIHQFGVEKAA